VTVNTLHQHYYCLHKQLFFFNNYYQPDVLPSDLSNGRKFEHEKRIECEKEETALLREASQRQINRQVERAKVDFQALGDSLAAQ
jgi:hypothetical protein